MSVIKTGTTSTTGYIVESDTNGNLVIQTGSTPTTALTLNSNQTATFAQSVNIPNTFGMKNRIINGGMVIDQRNAGAAVTPAASTYTLDRWRFGCPSARMSVQQNAGGVTPPSGFRNYIGATTTSAYSPAAAEAFTIAQMIEGTNVGDFMLGTSSAITFTLSFWVRSSLTGTFGASFNNENGGTRSYPFSYTINSANTWEFKTITIQGDTTGTWNTNTSTGLAVFFSLGAGSNFIGTSGAWANGDLRSVSGATSVVATNGATFYITGVQLERGSTATSFDFRPYGTELMLCQRYYYRTADDGSNTNLISGGVESSTVMTGGGGSFPVAMRSAPTMAMGSGVRVYSFATGTQTTSINANRCSSTTMAGAFSMSSATGGQAATIFRSTSSGYLEFSSEL